MTKWYGWAGTILRIDLSEGKVVMQPLPEDLAHNFIGGRGVNSKILLDNVGNAGPKLENSPENLRRQYQRAFKHNLLKADYLKLKLESPPKIHYNIVQIDCPAGFREDDYQSYRSWQDTEEIGYPPEYYQKKGFEYIIVTDRYFSKIEKEFKLIKEFKRGHEGIRIYKVDL